MHFSLFLLQLIIEQMEAVAGPWTPLLHVAVFMTGSLLIIWRLELMTHRGVGGTVLGTLFMPYFSGLGNLIFVAVVLRQNGPPAEVAVNSLVNNITNICVLLTVPALIWGLNLRSQSKKKKDLVASQLNRLSLGLTLLAMIFFSSVVWLLAQDGHLDRYDGFVRVGLFLFWQAFHVYEVLRENTRRQEAWSPAILFDVTLILIGSFLTLISIDGLVGWIMASESGLLGPAYLGIITGLLMVLPNALLAFYYARKRQTDVVYASQVGDAHICIPLCLGLFAIFQPMPVPEFVSNGLLLIAGVAAIHLFCLGFLQRLPKFVALGLILIFCAAAILQAKFGG